MAKYINEAFWWSSLGRPDWYLLLSDDFKRLEKLAGQRMGDPDHKEIKREAYSIVEKAIHENHIPLADNGNNLDTDRKPIDAIVIHHTKNPSGMTLKRLNAMQLLRIYGRYYANPTDERERYLKGKSVWSGHFYKGQQVFWGYHWLVRSDGISEQILEDQYIGWHAGNWDVNTRSVGICIDDDLSNKEPGETCIKAVATIIQQHYSNVDRRNIVGHGNVNKQTECPGNLFYEQWRQKLLDLVAA